MCSRPGVSLPMHTIIRYTPCVGRDRIFLGLNGDAGTLNLCVKLDILKMGKSTTRLRGASWTVSAALEDEGMCLGLVRVPEVD